MVISLSAVTDFPNQLRARLVERFRVLTAAARRLERNFLVSKICALANWEFIGDYFIRALCGNGGRKYVAF